MLSVTLRHASGQNFPIAYPAHVDATNTKSGRKVGDDTLQIVKTDDVNNVCTLSPSWASACASRDLRKNGQCSASWPTRPQRLHCPEAMMVPSPELCFSFLCVSCCARFAELFVAAAAGEAVAVLLSSSLMLPSVAGAGRCNVVVFSLFSLR